MRLFQPLGVERLFYSPLFFFRIDGFAELNQRLIADSKNLQLQLEGLKKSNRNGWHSPPFLFERPEASFKELCNAILLATHVIARDHAPSFDIDRYKPVAKGWINVNNKFGYNTPHEHPGFCWSGAYYASVPVGQSEQQGCIEFLDHRSINPYAHLLGAPLSSSKYRVQPEAGLLLIFPSDLKHWVYPNETDADRISIAFNLKYEPK